MSLFELRPEQKAALEKLRKNRCVYLHWETGCGKTFFFVYIVRAYWRAFKRKKRVLILCPPIVNNTYKDLFPKAGINNHDITFLDSEKSRSSFKAGQPFKTPVLVMSYSFFRSAWKNHRQTLNSFSPSAVIFDEIHYLKSNASKTTKAVTAFRNTHALDFAVGGSGTPVEGGLFNLFWQLYALDQGKTFGSNYDAFEATYFYDKNARWKRQEGYYPRIILRNEKVKEFFEKINPIYDKLELSQMKNKKRLPKRNFYTIKVPLTEKQEFYQKHLKERAFIEFQSLELKRQQKKITKQQKYMSVLGKISVFRQLCCGFVYEKGVEVSERTVMKVPTNKLLSLYNGIKTACKNDQFIVFSEFIQNYADISQVLKQLNISHSAIHGGTSNTQKAKALKAFDEGKSQALILHSMSGGTGLNLQQAKHLIFYSLGYSFTRRKQALGRNFRLNSGDFLDRINVIDIVCKNSIEEAIFANLGRKKNEVEAFVSFLKTNGNGAPQKRVDGQLNLV